MLEEQHQKLTSQNRDLHKLCSAFYEMIHGHYSQAELTSLEQLRTEPGYEGLRAQALEAKILRPIVCEAGGLTAFVSQMTTVRSLIEQAGGLPQLVELVSEQHLMKISVDEAGGLQGLHDLISEVEGLRKWKNESKAVLEGPTGYVAKARQLDEILQAFGGLQGLHDLISEVESLRAKQNEEMGSRAALEGPDGLVAKAAKFDRLVRAFGDIQNASLEAERVMPNNPAPLSRTGSNKEPLGPRPARERSTSRLISSPPSKRSHDYGRLKREVSEDLGAGFTVNKRPRLESGRSSALVQSSRTTRIAFETSRSTAMTKQKQPRFDQLAQTLWNQLRDAPRSVAQPIRTMAPPTAPRADVGARSTSTQVQPAVSIADMGARSTSVQLTASVSVHGYPIAIWAGASSAMASMSDGVLRKMYDLPGPLTFLAGELNKYITSFNVQLLHSMPANGDTCVLRYLIEGHRPSGQPQERRACLYCTSVQLGNYRPCALLWMIGGVRTIVFLPLKNGMIGKHADCRNAGHYMLGVQ
jgi:hypothetical protein